MKGITLGILLTKAAFGWTLVSQGISGWESRELVFYVNPTNCPIAEATLYDIIDRAIDSWNGVSTTSIVLTRAAQASTNTPTDFLAGTATDVPLFVCDNSFSSTNGVDADFVPAATRLAFSGSRIHTAAIMLNAELGTDAEISQLSNEQLSITLAHEIGHVLGLGHSGTKEALMYYSISDKTSSVLTQDDTDGLTALYPRNEFRANPFGCASVRDEERGGLPWGLFIFPIWLVLSILGGRKLHPRARECT